VTRMEIITNQAIEEDIITLLELHGFGESFTCTRPVYGRGRHGRREGSAVWPEENVIFLIYMEDDRVETLLPDLKRLKGAFSDEGLRCYVQRGAERLV